MVDEHIIDKRANDSLHMLTTWLSGYIKFPLLLHLFDKIQIDTLLQLLNAADLNAEKLGLTPRSWEILQTMYYYDPIMRIEHLTTNKPGKYYLGQHIDFLSEFYAHPFPISTDHILTCIKKYP